MLVLAFIGLIITDIRDDGGWDYWLFVVPFYAVLALCLSWFLRLRKQSHAVAYVWHEILHWLGVMLSIYLVFQLVQIGLLNRFAASLQVVTLLALGVFIAGVYIEISFLIVGLLLGCGVIAVALFAEYLYTIAAILVVISAILLYFLSRRQKKRDIFDV